MTRDATDEQLEDWWVIERTRPRYRYGVGPGMDGWHHVLSAMLTWDTASATVFRRLYALARSSDERCSLVGWFLIEQHWVGDEEFVRWLRDAAREDPEVGAALRFYEIYPEVTDSRTIRLLGGTDGVAVHGRRSGARRRKRSS